VKPSTVPVSLRSTLSILFFQGLFYGVALTLLYWVLTLNYKMLLISSAISLAQEIWKPKKNRRYKSFVLGYMKPQEYFFVDRCYEEKVPED
jgi:hypothetical protein